MTSGPLSTGDAEYDAIEAAVLETARGRWFLAEYARRNRHADTDVVTDSIAGIAKALRELEARIDAMLAAQDRSDAIAPEAEAEGSSDPLRAAAPAHLEGDETFGRSEAPAWPEWETEEANDAEPVFASADDLSFEESSAQAAPPLPAPRPAADRTLTIPSGSARMQVNTRPADAVMAPPPYRRPRGDPLAAIRALGYEEKIALFT